MKKIVITVKTNSHQKAVEKIDDMHYQVAVKEPPVEGRANKAVIEAVADYFALPKSAIIISSGQKSKKKVLEIGKIGL
ncbi:MAG: DUF167 domain-containing protein [bacterium]|nr:DUF167 domain-containing protein [bacterium]